MLIITHVKIQRYRSILELEFDIDKNGHIVTLCGQNNVGKTNTLRAIGLFFNPEYYDPKKDLPKLKIATGGGSVDTKIDLTFFDDDTDDYYSLSRNFKYESDLDKFISGVSYKQNNKGTKKKLEKEDINKIMGEIEYLYIGSINTDVPLLINSSTQEMLTLQYGKSRFSQTKRDLKRAYEQYVNGLNEILGLFAQDISHTFKNFRDNWEVKLEIPKNVETFRDLISDKTEFSIFDSGSTGVVDKGSGLQRLAHILLQFEIAEKISRKKSVIISIDEPDIYLHDGLQHKLSDFFVEKSKNFQILYTTHSKNFIDTYHLTNTLLLNSKYHDQYIARKKRHIPVIETYLVDIGTDDGHKMICEHLGIKENSSEQLDKHNLFVEGMSDKIYLEKLIKYFGYKSIKIISMNGVGNAIKYLEYYESIYKNSKSFKPIIKVVFDNDSAGREAYSKILSKEYQHITVYPIILNNYLNNADLNPTKNTTNNEIEDLLYPELLCMLINDILQNKKDMNKIDAKKISSQIATPSLNKNGILALCEHEKNIENPKNGMEISFSSSSNDCSRIKDGLANILSIEGNKKMITQLNAWDKQYPEVRKIIKELVSFNE